MNTENENLLSFYMASVREELYHELLNCSPSLREYTIRANCSQNNFFDKNYYRKEILRRMNSNNQEGK